MNALTLSPGADVKRPVSGRAAARAKSITIHALRVAAAAGVILAIGHAITVENTIEMQRAIAADLLPVTVWGLGVAMRSVADFIRKGGES